MGTEGCWLARPEGNLQVFNTKEEGGTTCYGIVTLKNPNWPGWLTVTNVKKVRFRRKDMDQYILDMDTN